MTRSVLAATVFVFLAAACGGSDSDTGVAVATTATPSDAPAATTAPATTPALVGVAAPDLAGTSWSVTKYTMAEGSLTGVLDGTEVTIIFGNDGTISGFTGCNDYTGTFEVEGPYDPFEEGIRDANDGQIINIGSISVTERACDSPGFVMEQEGEHLVNLVGVERWFMARGNLTMRGEETFIEAVPVNL